MAITADQILSATTTVKRLPFDIEDVGRVWVYRLSSCDAKILFNSMERNDKGAIDDPYDDAKLIVKCVRDDDGNQIFTDKDLPRIVTMGNDIVVALVNLCLEINGMTESARKGIAKNSETTPGDDSSSE